MPILEQIDHAIELRVDTHAHSDQIRHFPRAIGGCLALFVVGDNLRNGATLNALQIADLLVGVTA